jgi:hypothetical protein
MGRCKILNIIGENEEREFYLNIGWRTQGREEKGGGARGIKRERVG